MAPLHDLFLVLPQTRFFGHSFVNFEHSEEAKQPEEVLLWLVELSHFCFVETLLRAKYLKENSLVFLINFRHERLKDPTIE